MTIAEHKALVAAIPEDLGEGEEIEVSDDGKVWRTVKFRAYRTGHIEAELKTCSGYFAYARRPAATQKKRLRDELWTDDDVFKFRAVDKNGNAHYYEYEPEIVYEYDGLRERIGVGYDSTDWQNSLERRPE